MEKILGISPNTLHTHRKFQLQIDINDELACWVVICRQPYKYKLGEDVKKNNIWILDEKFMCFTKCKGCDVMKNSMKLVWITCKTYLGQHLDRFVQ